MAERHRSGKLAVILHADIAGSTTLVQQDEHLAHERIQDTFGRFSNTIEKYQGRVCELRGDALLAEFERASDAVSAALAFQSDQAYHNSRLKDDIRPNVRVGIAMGEVVIADNTVTGAGVVLAQRVEQLADPGGVCITAALHEALPKRMPFDQENLGEQQVKGFDEAVRVYRVELRPGESIPLPQESHQLEASPKTRRPIVAIAVMALIVAGGAAYWFKPRIVVEEPASVENPDKSSIAVPPATNVSASVEQEPASVERMAFPLPDKPSIAVLPFTNMSGDPEQEYFVDGMTEDLITDLSQVAGLFVIARNSVFTYKDKAVKVKQVSEELGVRYVLEGSVRRAGDQVRINAQLIDATTGGHLWAARYDGSLADVFTLQDNVTKQIVAALALNLTETQTTKPDTASAQAYDQFLQGWAHYQRHTANDSSKAVPYFEAAIRLDSNYSQAHAALAAVYWETWDNRWAESLDISLLDVMKKAKNHLEQAMKEPSSLAHWVASNILIAEGNYETAVIEAEQIVALDVNNADGYATLANALTLSGKPDQSVKLIEKAVRLDPNSSPLHAAAQNGDTDTVRRLIAEEVFIDVRDYYNKTSLHIAAENGHAEIIALLIGAGADIEAKTSLWDSWQPSDVTPLMLAASSGHSKAAELLISAGADVNARDRNELTVHRFVLFYAVYSGHTSVAELLIANGANVNERLPMLLYTPLSEAARNGQKAMAELLISKGANVNAADGNASTPLHAAAAFGNLGIVQLLLANGADINAKTVGGGYPGATPLHATAFAGQTQITELLLADGADIDAADQYGYTPLRRTVDQGYLAMAELPIKKGADIATRDTNGVTLLHVIAQTDNVALAELLIKAGADVNAKNLNLGWTPLDYAQDGEPKMIEILEQYGSICTSC